MTRSFGDSELRQDPITGKWVILATGRGKKSQDILKSAPVSADIPPYKEECPFCNQKKFPQKKETMNLPNRGEWRVRSFPNMFPALVEGTNAQERHEGPYRAMEGVGFHEVVISRDHNAYPYRMSEIDLMFYFKVLRERFLFFTKQPAVNYVQIIENHNFGAGASLEHMHGQIFALPIVPTDEVLDLLDGAEKYFDKNKRCGYCDIIKFEKRKKSRVIYENELFIVLAPFAPRVSYEQRILPKAHHPGFERLTDLELPALVDVIKKATQALNKALDNPPYNMYLYSSPCDDIGSYYPREQYKHFHWQIHFLPRINMQAGFEMATGVEISATLPEQDALSIKKQITL